MDEAASYVYSEVGRRIRTERLKQAGLTQEKLAERAHLTRSSITNIERGKQKLLVHTLCDIADALGVEPASLLPERSGPVDARKVLDSVRTSLTPTQRAKLLSAVGQLQLEDHDGSSPPSR